MRKLVGKGNMVMVNVVQVRFCLLTQGKRGIWGYKNDVS